MNRRWKPLATVLVAVAASLAPGGRDASATVVGAGDWPAYGRGPERTFHGPSAITAANVTSLREDWFFETGDAVTAQPVVVAGTLYVGSWDGNFYAVDAATGAERWRYRVKDQPAVIPHPGADLSSRLQATTSDGGLITSSAWFKPGAPGVGKVPRPINRDRRKGRPDLVLFGGGFTLYALRASDGSVWWMRDLTGRPELPPDPDNDGTRIFSSPVVVEGQVIVGTSADGAFGFRGYIASVDLDTGALRWRLETDVDAAGNVLNDGCSGVWSSGTYDAVNGTVVFSTADCDFTDNAPFAEVVIALRPADGSLAWKFRPPRPDPGCDWDFGATANLGTLPDGTRFVGVGGKDGTYYALDPATGALRWSTNVVFGGFAGGFIGSSAFDGNRVYGATALGDFGQVAGFGFTTNCSNGNLHDNSVQEPSIHAFDAATGSVLWQDVAAQSFGATTVSNGLVYSASVTRQIQVRDAVTGVLRLVLPQPSPTNSGVVPVGDAIYFGFGGPEPSPPHGVVKYRLNGGL